MRKMRRLPQAVPKADSALVGSRLNQQKVIDAAPQKAAKIAMNSLSRVECDEVNRRIPS
jgi:hypothetical protein